MNKKINMVTLTEAEYDKLVDERDALEKDAARYRWLRDSDHWPAAFVAHDAPEPMRGPELDDAIDAAMSWG